MLKKWIVLDLKMMLRDGETLFWILLFPLFFVFLMWVLVGNDGSIGDQEGLALGVVDLAQTEESQRFVDVLSQTPGASLETGELSVEKQALSQGERSLVIIIEPGSENASSPFSLHVLGSGPGYDVGLALIRMAMLQIAAGPQVAQDGALTQAVRLEPDFSSPPSYMQELLVSTAGMAVWVSVANATLVTFVGRRQRGVLRRLSLTAFGPAEYIPAEVIIHTLVVCVQIALLITFGVFVFGLPLNPWLFLLPVAAALGTLSFISIGFALTGWIRTVEVGNILSSVLINVMIFFGDVIFPIEAAPAIVKWVSRLLPLTYLNAGLKHLFFNSDTPLLALKDFGILTVWGAIGFLVAVKVFRWDEPRTS